MKRVFFSLILSMVIGLAFAQEKNVKEAESIVDGTKPDFASAEKLIDAALTNPETKNDPKTWNTAAYVQSRIDEEEMKNAYLKKPYDTLKVYNSILKMYEYYVKCDELAQIPNAKGKIKNKFRKSNAQRMMTERPNLINGGIQYFNMNKSDEALKFFGTYVESASYPMLADKNIAKNDTLLPQIAYYAALAANNTKNKDAVIKYAPIAIQDKANGKFAMQLLADAYKSKGDTLKWIKTLEEGIIKFPDNDYYFANLIDHFNSKNQPEKAMEFADNMLQKDPNNKLYLYVKGYLYHNMKNYDKALEYYQKAVDIDPKYAEAYSNMGLIYLIKAQNFADKSTTDINDPTYAQAQKTIKEYYEKAKPFYEKTRELKPDQKDLWIQGLYRIYYNLHMGPQFEEIDKLLKNK
ncbi:MAG: tetratricopeptide repeat protein [Bacteroidaceae bacterium]|nr:tetratricopeptide repeat protein [Bacteroidaceae bacterium]